MMLAGLGPGCGGSSHGVSLGGAVVLSPSTQPSQQGL